MESTAVTVGKGWVGTRVLVVKQEVKKSFWSLIG